ADSMEHSAADDLNLEDEADLEMRDLESDIDDLARMDGIGPEAIDDMSGTEDAEAGAEPGQPGADADGIDPADPFRGERPAIRLVETPMRRDSDKIIDLEARRPRLPRESLSPGEQAAFREIGARLTEATESGPDAMAQPFETDAESAPPEHQPVFGKRQAAHDDDQPEVSSAD